MAEETANAVTNSDNSIANTLDPIVEITQADTLDAFRLSFNTMANLVNESPTSIILSMEEIFGLEIRSLCEVRMVSSLLVILPATISI